MLFLEDDHWPPQGSLFKKVSGSFTREWPGVSKFPTQNTKEKGVLSNQRNPGKFPKEEESIPQLFSCFSSIFPRQFPSSQLFSPSAFPPQGEPSLGTPSLEPRRRPHFGALDLEDPGPVGKAKGEDFRMFVKLLFFWMFLFFV